jgi:hypothetical protein
MGYYPRTWLCGNDNTGRRKIELALPNLLRYNEVATREAVILVNVGAGVGHPTRPMLELGPRPAEEPASLQAEPCRRERNEEP